MARAEAEHPDGVCSLEQKRREREILEALREQGRKYGIEEIIPVRAEDIVVAHWVRLKCKYGCRKYGTSWCCAPETPGPEQTKAILSEYSKALILRASVGNDQFYRDNSRKRRTQVTVWKGVVALERFLFLHGYYKAFSLVAERCALCKECLYPEACRFPMDRRPSVESVAIDVFQTLRNVGREPRIAEDVRERYDCYSIILLE